jgi:hypothetical protein
MITIQLLKKYTNMNKLKILILVFTSLLAIECKKMDPTTVLSDDEKRFNDIKSKLDVATPIIEPIGEYYCEGILNGKFFRYTYTGNYNFPFAGDDKYCFQYGFENGNKKDTADIIGFSFAKEKKWENRNMPNEIPRYSNMIIINIPALYTNDEYKLFKEGNFFTKGKSFNFNTNTNGLINGISISFNNFYGDFGFFSQTDLSVNSQNSSNYCILDDITKKETATQYIYDMTFKFDVRLYVNVGSLGIINPKYLTSITDGVFRTRYIIEK